MLVYENEVVKCQVIKQSNRFKKKIRILFNGKNILRFYVYQQSCGVASV